MQSPKSNPETTADRYRNSGDPTVWRSPRLRMTHRFLAQAVKLVDQNGDQYLVEFEDGSSGWHAGPLIPIAAVDREALK